MKAFTILPAVVAFTAIIGFAVMAPAEDENIYIQERALPPNLSSAENDTYDRPTPPSQEYTEDSWQEKQPTNGEKRYMMDGEVEILLPAPRPVYEEPRQINGDWPSKETWGSKVTASRTLTTTRVFLRSTPWAGPAKVIVTTAIAINRVTNRNGFLLGACFFTASLPPFLFSC